MGSRVEFYKHNIGDEEKAAVQRALDSLFLSSGTATQDLEGALGEYLRRRYVCAVMSATHALEMCLRYIGVGGSDEVITTAMTFVATANAIEQCHARCVFTDVCSETGCITPSAIRAALTVNTRAVIVVHLYGQLCDMRCIRAVIDDWNAQNGGAVKLIEDCAHTIAATRDGVRCGELSDFSCYSFYATKNVTCGEGGAVATDCPAADRYFRMCRQHGMSSTAADRYKTTAVAHYDVPFVGMKCNLNDVLAAMLLPQIKKIEGFRQAKERLSERYTAAFEPLARQRLITIPRVADSSLHDWHLYVVWVNGGAAARDSVLQHLRSAGVGCTVNYTCVPLFSYYQQKYNHPKGSFPIAERIGEGCISLPLYVKLSEESQDIVIEEFTKAVARYAAPPPGET